MLLRFGVKYELPLSKLSCWRWWPWNEPEPPDRKSFVGEFEWSAKVGDPHVIGGVARGELESLGREVREC
jgi:hypothetical protein